MLFNSLPFLIFFPLVTLCYFLLPHRYRWLLLLAASCYFYMSFIPKYLIILAVLITIDYFAGLAIASTEGKRRRIYLIASITANVGMLFVFKYFNFFNANFAAMAEWLHWNYPVKYLSLALPLGLSFHAFQSMSYVIEVYRGRYKAEKHFGIYALYVMFFPQLVAGPIERPYNLLPQFYEKMIFKAERVTSGLRLMLWGFFKKLVVADNAALIVNSIYNNPTEHNGVVLAIATLFFTLQIYADFSGYSDIAIGAARVMGFNLMKNFNCPYLSKSIQEFWRKWHISLMSWFRDYVYIPIGGSRVRLSRWVVNIFIVFFLSGLWHGANWTFVAWGLINAFYIVLSKFTARLREKAVQIVKLDKFPKIHSGLQIIITFLLISFSWIFFRSASISDAIFIIKHIFSDIWSMTPHLFNIPMLKSIYLSLTNISLEQFITFALAIGIVGCVEIIQQYHDLPRKLSLKPLWFRWSVYYTVILYILFFGYLGGQSFIYFAF